MTTTSVTRAALDADELAAFVPTLPGWPWDGQDISMHRISGGLTNVNWRMHVASTSTNFFLKVPGIGTEAFIDRNAANQAARVAAETGVGPGVVYFDPETGIEVTEFLEGYTSSTEASLGEPEAAMQLMAMYRSLHAGRLLPVTKTIFDMIDEHLEQVKEIDRSLRPWQRSLVERWAPVQAAYLSSGLDLVPGHNDMLPSNFMVKDGAPMMLIDYDYAANNERSYEVGGITSLYLIDPDLRHAMLEEYHGTVTAQLEARAWVAGIATDVKWGLWALLNSQQRDFDFDFEKYGNARLLHGLQLMNDPRLEEWVSAL